MRVTISREGLCLHSNLAARAVAKCWSLVGRGELEVSKLLMGGECGRSAASYARTIGDLLRPSRPIAESPHAALLRDYQAEGESIFSPGRFEMTAYYQNAAQCIETFGSYFGAREPGAIFLRAKRFLAMFDGKLLDTPGPYENTPGSLPVARRIRFSDCYEIVHGLHRLSIAAVRGTTKEKCIIELSEPVLTPLQQMVMDSSWNQESRELYQPVPSAELSGWQVIRRCTDRLEMMTRWLDGRIRGGSYLDIGCSYGWFGAEMAKRGFKISGVDRDAAALAVGHLVYGLDGAANKAGDIVKFLDAQTRQYDVVSCFSVLHHFALGKMQHTAEELIRRIDAVTAKVLFFDTAESHERWFSADLPAWDAEFIREWLRDHTSFSRVETLGTDGDSVGRYRSQYGRHLFVCSRSLLK
ncbi:MAG: class I SAM-dependent methyltransferase [Terriglobales bacterium]